MNLAAALIPGVLFAMAAATTSLFLGYSFLASLGVYVVFGVLGVAIAAAANRPREGGGRPAPRELGSPHEEGDAGPPKS